MGYDDASGRVIIPYPGSDYYHIDRLITGGSTNAPKYIKPKSSLVGPEPIWNPDALEEDCFFVVEGPFDAIAVQSCGYPAVALCGTGHDALVKALIDKQYQGTVVIMLDCDLAGIKAACSMEQKLFDSKIKCGIADIGDLLPEAIRAEHLKAEKARRKEASGW